MREIDNIQRYEIYVDAEADSPGFWKFVHSNGSRSGFPEFDFYVPIFLTKTYDIFEYVQVDKQEGIQPIERQEFNPFFIEFGFFDTIKRNKVNHGSELTSAMINFIRIRRQDVSNLSDNELRRWYDDIGVNEFPWNKGTAIETTASDIDESTFVVSNIVSKAKFFNIDINK